MENVQLVVRNCYAIEAFAKKKKWERRKKRKQDKEISCGTTGNSSLEFCLNMAYRSFRSGNVQLQEKVTTGITGLWQPSVHIDVAL